MRALDLLNLIMLCVLSAITLTTLRAAPQNVVVLAAYLAMALMLLIYDKVRPSRLDFPKWFRRVYPVLYICIIFDSIAWVLPLASVWQADDLLMWLDRRLLGVDATVYLQRFVFQPAVEVLYIAYMLYFVLPFALIWCLWRAGKLREITHFACLITIALYSNYILYFVFPAIGPRLYVPHSVQLDGVFLTDFLRGLLNGLESNKCDVFPSAHVNASLVVLYGFAKLYRRHAVPVAVTVLGIAVSTVYLRYHYVVDVLAGVALAAAAVWAGNLYYAWMTGAASPGKELGLASRPQMGGKEATGGI